MDIPLDVEVRCTNGVCGSTYAIVLNPVTETITHVVVRTKGLVHDEYLVPLDVITESTPHYIQLDWSEKQLAESERFTKAIFVGSDGAGLTGEEMPGTEVLWPYSAASDPYGGMTPPAYMEIEQVPHDELAIHRGAHVDAIDGHVGKVDEFVINPDNSHITHLVLRKGHLWGKKDVTISLSEIDRVEDDVVYLKLDKAAVGRLPSIPVRRR